MSVVDLVTRLRAKLETLDAERQKKGNRALFALDSVEVGLQFTVVTASGNGDADLRILTAGTRTAYTTAVQKARLHFTVDETARRAGVLGSRMRRRSTAGGEPSGAARRMLSILDDLVEIDVELGASLQHLNVFDNIKSREDLLALFDEALPFLPADAFCPADVLDASA